MGLHYDDGQKIAATRTENEPANRIALNAATAILMNFPFHKVLYVQQSQQVFCSAQRWSLAVANRHQEPEASAFADRMMGLTLWATGRFSEAALHLRRAVALYAPGRGNVTDLRYSQDHAVWAQMMLASTLWALGYPQQAASAATQSIAWARTIGHAMTTGFALAFGSVLNAFLSVNGSSDRPFSEEALKYCLEQDLRAYQPWAEFYHGLTLLPQGKHTSGLEAMIAGMDKAEKINMNMVRALHLGYVASARAAGNQFEAALEGFDQSFAIIERTEERMFEANCTACTRQFSFGQGGLGKPKKR
jgi:hypothetical protein